MPRPSAKDVLTLGPLVAGLQPREGTPDEHAKSGWQNAREATVGVFERPAGPTGAVLAVLIAALVTPFDFVGDSTVLRAVQNGVAALLAYWLAPTVYAGYKWMTGPAKQRDKARKALKAERTGGSAALAAARLDAKAQEEKLRGQLAEAERTAQTNKLREEILRVLHTAEQRIPPLIEALQKREVEFAQHVAEYGQGLPMSGSLYPAQDALRDSADAFVRVAYQYGHSSLAEQFRTAQSVHRPPSREGSSTAEAMRADFGRMTSIASEFLELSQSPS